MSGVFGSVGLCLRGESWCLLLTNPLCSWAVVFKFTLWGERMERKRGGREFGSRKTKRCTDLLEDVLISVVGGEGK